MKRIMLVIICMAMLVGCAPVGVNLTQREIQCMYANEAVALADAWLSDPGMAPALHEYWAKYQLGARDSVKILCGN
jgi:hypothetical protein